MKEEQIGAIIDDIKNNMPVLRRIMDRYFFQTNEKLPRHQVFCLHFLSNCIESSMGGLAEEMGVSNQQLTRIVDALAEDGLIERCVSPENRRVVLVKMSERGRNFVEQSDKRTKQQATEILSALSEQELAELIGHLRALKGLLSKIVR